MSEVLEIYLDALSFSLEDSPWKAFGYSKRPKCGLFFMKFRPAWKNDLEARILRELVNMYVVAYASAGYCDLDAIDKFANTPGAVALRLNLCDWYTGFFFSSEQEALYALKTGCGEYLSQERSSWVLVLSNRVRTDLILDEKLKVSVIMGMARFNAHMTLVADHLKASRSQQLRVGT